MDKDTKEKGKEMLAQIEADKVRVVALQFTDLGGHVKSVDIPSHSIAEALEKGIWFDGSSVEGFARIQESDMFLKLDPSTYRVLPWEKKDYKVARVICDVYQDGAPLPNDPRYVLKRVLAYATQKGVTYNTGAEVEFFLFDKKKQSTHDTGGYFDFNEDAGHRVRMQLIDVFEALGMKVEMSHHEVAPGQHEIDIRFADALTTADNIVTLKYAVLAIARKNGLEATFMPKPKMGINGSGMHTHQSIFRDGKNVFYDEKDLYRLSPYAYHFIGGQLKHARALAAVVAPTVNSYKRLVPGYEAPVYISWARHNRSALIRVPKYSPGRENSTRAELRFPDPSCNPYLAFAVMFAAGVDGMLNKITPPSPVEENVYHLSEEELKAHSIGTLPETLSEALAELAKDEVLKKALGNKTYETFTRLKRAEWDKYRLYVSPWERDTYF